MVTNLPTGNLILEFSEVIFFLSGLSHWKILPREPLCQSVITNLPTGHSTLGGYDGRFGHP